MSAKMSTTEPRHAHTLEQQGETTKTQKSGSQTARVHKCEDVLKSQEAQARLISRKCVDHLRSTNCPVLLRRRVEVGLLAEVEGQPDGPATHIHEVGELSYR